MAAKAFRKTVFPNGLTLVTERLPGFRSLSIGIWVKVGTRHESPRDAGASHFLEHMLFKGTAKRSALEIAREIDEVGGEFNAFTAREYTCFHVLLLSRDVDLAVDVLSDILLDSDFDSVEFERERKVILQEIAMVEDSPEELAHDLFFEVIYGKHSLGKPILGTETSIRRMKRTDLIRYFRKHYRPDQLVISVAGDIGHETVRKKIRSLSKGSWPGRPKAEKGGRGAVTRSGSGARPPVRKGCWWIPRQTEQVHLIWGVEAAAYHSRDRFASLLMNIHMGGGMSSVLFQEIRERRGLAYTVYSSQAPFVDSGIFSVYVATGMNQVPVCLRLIEDCAEQLRTQLMSEEELQRAKENLKGTLLLNADNVEARMSSIAKSEIFFRQYYPVDQICRLIDEVKPADVRRVARKLFGGDQRSIVVVGPRPSRKVRQALSPKVIKR